MRNWLQFRRLRKERPLLFTAWLLLWLLEATLVGLLAGVLAYGWLNQGFGWPSWVAFFAGFGLCAGLRLWQRSLLLTGQSAAAKRLQRRLVLVPLLVVFSLLTVSVWELAAGGLLWPARGRDQQLRRLLTALERYYPYFDKKQIAWDSLQAEYLPRLRADTSVQAFREDLAEFLANFQDVHTGLLNSSQPDSWRGYLAVRPIAGKAVVTAVRAGLELPGLKPGAVILERDGQSVGQFLACLPLYLRSSSTPWSAEQTAYAMLGFGAPAAVVGLTYLGPDGLTRRAQLSWQAEFDQPSSVRRPNLSYRRLESGVGVIRLQSLSGAHLVAQFDQALAEMSTAPGIILDLRDNGGGNSLLGDRIAGRFLDQSFVYGEEYYRQRLPQRAWAKRASYLVRPRGTTYSGPLVVLTGPRTVSSAEMLVVALKDSGRALLVGQTTAGGSGNPLQLSIAGSLVRFSSGDFRRNDGTPIEGVGIAPDLSIEWTVADVALGRDPDLAAAEAAILQQVATK